MFRSKYVLDVPFRGGGVAVECEYAAINKLSKAGKVGGSGPQRDRGVGGKSGHR